MTIWVLLARNGKNMVFQISQLYFQLKKKNIFFNDLASKECTYIYIYIYNYTYRYDGALNIQKKTHNKMFHVFFFVAVDPNSFICNRPLLANIKNISRIFRELHIFRGTHVEQHPLMKIQSSPAKSHQITTDNFLRALQTCS